MNANTRYKHTLTIHWRWSLSLFSLEPAADQTDNVNLFHWQFQTPSQNIFISVWLRPWNTC